MKRVGQCYSCSAKKAAEYAALQTLRDTRKHAPNLAKPLECAEFPRFCRRLRCCECALSDPRPVETGLDLPERQRRDSRQALIFRRPQPQFGADPIRLIPHDGQG